LLSEEALEQAVQGLKPEDLTGPGGLLTQLAGRVIEAALEAELAGHLGYPPGQSPPEANKRNGGTAIWGRCRCVLPATATRAFSRGWLESARPGSPAWMSGCSTCTPAVCRPGISPRT